MVFGTAAHWSNGWVFRLDSLDDVDSFFQPEFRLGYASPQAFRDSMNTEAGQLDAFARFIKATPAAHDALQRMDWQAFENAYNGGGFGWAYAAKMRDAYERRAA